MSICILLFHLSFKIAYGLLMEGTSLLYVQPITIVMRELQLAKVACALLDS